MKASWATRPLFTLSSRACRALRAVSIAAIALMSISPAIFTLGWHLIHGNTVETRGTRVFVPLRWVAYSTDAMDVQMEKLPLTVLGSLRFYGMISVGRNFSSSHARPEEIYRSWESIYWYLADAGAVVSGPVRIGSGAHETICMESSYPRAPKQASASCLILQGQWRADFYGDRDDLNSFYEILRKMD